jgi:hypothetical protein
MIRHLTAIELGGIAARGGSLEVNASQFTAVDLGGIAARLSDGATLKLHNSACFNALDLEGIAARKPGQIIFC